MKMVISTLVVLFFGVTSQAQLIDEVIVDQGKTGKDWSSEIVVEHEIWQKPACSAYTMSADGESTLEVIAYYNASTNSFSEPEVNVVTVSNFSFLDVRASTSGATRSFQLLPVQPANINFVGARVLFDDREDLVSAIRRHNDLTARYLDSAGEVKSARFSLRGSSDAISSQFKRCGLLFLPEIDLPKPL